ncbi:hypothetical protein CBP05_04760 [Pseudomonas putida]|nr:hypothetical protein CBP05_04760 [Pseudomonas putida]
MRLGRLLPAFSRVRKGERPARSPVGAGLPANGPGLLANLHPPFTVVAATVFAGKPAPTPDQW